MNKWKFKSTSLIGLDIQPDAARIVQLKKTRRGFQLQQAAFEPLPADLCADGRIKNWDALREVLSNLAHMFGLRGEPTALCLPMQQVRMQRLTLPAGMSDAAIETEISLHLQQEMPGLDEPLCIDFNLLPAVDAAHQEALFAAVRETYFSSYVECARAAGFHVKIVDIDCYAARRAILVDAPLPQTPFAAQALLQIKPSQTEFLVFDQHELIFHQHWQTENISACAAQLKESRRIFAAAYRDYQIRLLALCAAETEARALKHAAAEIFAIKIILPAMTTQLLNAEHPDLQLLHAQSAEFMAAFGAAMLDVPPW